MKKFNWKPGAVAIAIFTAIVLTISFSLKSDNNFKVVHEAEIKGGVYDKTGRAAVGSPERYIIDVSPATALKLTKQNNRFWYILGWIILIVCSVLIILYANDIIVFGPNSTGGNYMVGACLAIALPCFIAAYSSAYSSNSITLTPEEYKAVEGDKAAMESLFTDKDYIR